MGSFVPTARAALILAVIAVCALFAPVVLAGAAAAVLLGGVLADAWSVRRPPVVHRDLSRTLSLGAEAPLSVRTVVADRRRVVLRQPATPALSVRNGHGHDALSGTVVARRRGRQELPGVASASIGPLGLARVHHPAAPAGSVRVYPDLRAARALIARLRRTLAMHPGLARGALGLGTEFESVRDYTPDDDVRQINWRATARMGRPMSNQYRLERDRDLVCLIDCGRLMRAPIGESTRLDLALAAVAALVLAADELGDRCGAIAFDDRPRMVSGPRHRGGRRLIDALIDLPAGAAESDFHAAFVRVGGSRRALVFVFTDLVDVAAARSLADAVPVLARRHALVVASLADPALVLPAPTTERELAVAVVAGDMLAAQRQAAARLRRAGAQVLEAPPERLPARCLDAYLQAKARVRL